MSNVLLAASRPPVSPGGARRRPHGSSRRRRPRPQHAPAPPSRGDGATLRIIPIGGCDEVGQNMTILEYGNDIVIMDMGVMFPEEDQPGVDFIIPNINYLKSKERNIRGIIITHAHFDHIGAVSYLAPRLGNPPIYATKLTNALVKKRHEEFRTQPLNLHTITPGELLQLGVFTVEPFYESHNIPDSIGFIIHTPVGIVVNTGDFKIDLEPVGTTPGDLGKIASLSDKNVLALLADSTSAGKPGHQISESDIARTLDGIVRETKGRLLIGLFSTLLSRIQQLLWTAEKYGRKVSIEGFSMRTNVEIARELRYMDVPKGLLLESRDLVHLPPEKQMILCTGAMGQERAALMRIANREHKVVHLEPTDTVIFSSSVIPGTERSVQRLKDSLARQGADIIAFDMMDVHAGGHACAEDLKLMIKLINPKYHIPIHGNYFMLVAHGKVAQRAGIPKENVLLPENGRVMEFDQNRNGSLSQERVPADRVMVDGLGVGDVSEIVLRDRKQLAEDGMVVIITTISRKEVKLVTSPDIISRGFVYLKESKPLIEHVRRHVTKIVDEAGGANGKGEPIDVYLRNKIRDDVGQLLYQKTERRPMILPVVIEV